MASSAKGPIKVMIVDDSAVVRQVLQAELSSDPDFRVIAAVSDPIFAMDRMRREWPDVIVLDLEMPRMDGLTFLRKLMSERPTPVVICSTLTEQGTKITADALAAGAVDIITKPKVGLRDFLQEARQSLLHAVKAASFANPSRLRPGAAAALQAPPPKLGADAVLPGAPPPTIRHTTERIVAIGTSTGGTQALEVVLQALPRDCQGIAVVQHMPERFTAAFAERLNSICQIEVREASGNEWLRPGLALIAPGGRHLVVRRNGARYHAEVVDGPLVNRHRPSVDVLFRSVARAAGPNAVGVIMTGMGDDGARGLKEMRDAGAHTLAEDESTCVVYGMPREAVRMGGVETSVPLQRIPAEILRLVHGH